MNGGAREILVIRHGALGDVLQCFGPFQAIRARHPHDRLTLLTGSPFKAIAEASGLFDRVWVDDRPPAWRIDSWLRLVLRLRAARVARAYDLERKVRPALRYRMLARGRRGEWAGPAGGGAPRG
ncbi:MAG: ADP-heptose--LPS heptosyltransferase, partial [Alphaproteobacteria bacterium]|nr:ADP-heptose--LPS heptosyltransferase [Alphaproteobacteria bacterium]